MADYTTLGSRREINPDGLVVYPRQASPQRWSEISLGAPTEQEIRRNQINRARAIEKRKVDEFKKAYERNAQTVGKVLSPQQVRALTLYQQYRDRPEELSIPSAELMYGKSGIDPKYPGPFTTNLNSVLTRATEDPRDFANPNKTYETPSAEALARSQGKRVEPTTHYTREGIWRSLIGYPAAALSGLQQGVVNKMEGRPWGSPVSNALELHNRSLNAPIRHDSRIPVPTYTPDVTEQNTDLTNERIGGAVADVATFGTDMSAWSAGEGAVKGAYGLGKRGLQALRGVRAAAGAGKAAAGLGTKLFGGPLMWGLGALDVYNNDKNRKLSRAAKYTQRPIPSTISRYNEVTGQPHLFSDMSHPYRSYGGALNNVPRLLNLSPEEREEWRENQRFLHEIQRLSSNYGSYMQEIPRLSQQIAQDRNDLKLYNQGKYEQLMNTRNYSRRNLKEHGTTVPDFGLPTKEQLASSDKRLADMRKSLAETKRRLAYITDPRGFSMNDYFNTDFSK